MTRTQMEAIRAMAADRETYFGAGTDERFDYTVEVGWYVDRPDLVTKDFVQCAQFLLETVPVTLRGEL